MDRLLHRKVGRVLYAAYHRQDVEHQPTPVPNCKLKVIHFTSFVR